MKIIKGNVNLGRFHLRTLGGSFMKNVHVEGHFRLLNNWLITLEGAPESVGRDFNCSYNHLTTLKGAPKSVGGHFDCNNNQLTSLEGAPKSVGGDFSCHSNAKKFTRNEVRAVCEVKGDIYT